MSNKYSQKRLDSAKKSTTDTIKAASKRAIQKIAEATDDLIGNKIAGKITTKNFFFEKVFQKNLQWKLIMKYLKNDIYLQKEDNKLLMN